MPRVERPRKFTCGFEDCKRKFGSESDKQRHQRIHTGEKPYICDYTWKDEITQEVFYCGKGFPQRTGLKTHMNTHTGKKPHECYKCHQMFADPSSKARHEKERHRTKGTYTCPVKDCPVGIKRRSAFVVHLKDKHGLTKDDVNIDDYAPEIEPKRFREERDRTKRGFKNGTPSDVSVSERSIQHAHPNSIIALPIAPPIGEYIDMYSPSKYPRVKDEDEEFYGATHTFHYGGPNDHYLASYHPATSLGVEDPQYVSYEPHYSIGPLHHDAYSAHSTPRAPTPQLLSSSSTDSSPTGVRLSGSVRYPPMLATPQSASLPIGYVMPVGSRPFTPPPHYLDEPRVHDTAFISHTSKSIYSYSAYDAAPSVHDG